MNLSQNIEEEWVAGHYERANFLETDVAYVKAKADVRINQTMLEDRMNVNQLDQVEDIVTYHWNKRKQQMQHKKVMGMMKPLDPTDMDDLNFQIARRKAVILQGEAFYNGIDQIDDPINIVSGSFRTRIDTTNILDSISPTKASRHRLHNTQYEEQPTPEAIPEVTQQIEEPKPLPPKPQEMATPV